MAIFNYQARTKEGEIQNGRVEAVNKRFAADILQREGLIVVAIEETKEVPIYARRIKFFEKIKVKDVVIFSRQLTTLFEAEVPLVTALQTVGNQTANSHFKEKIFEISADVEGGSSLSEAVSRHTGVFSDFYIHMVRAGEASGKLNNILSYLADHMEREYEIISKVKGAMIYPAFVVSAFLIAMVVMMIFVIPQLTGILKESGQELPLMTKIIIGTSDFLRSYWYILFIAVGGSVVLFFKYLKTAGGKLFWDRAQLKLPIFGPLLTKVYLFRFTESLSTLIEGGLPISRALSISRDITGNIVYKDIIDDALKGVRKGGTIAGTLALYKDIPPLVTQMISVGEQAGKLVSVLRSVARFYQKDVDNAMDNITSLIEPILIVAMGLGVGALVAGVMLPIYNMVGSF